MLPPAGADAGAVEDRDGHVGADADAGGRGCCWTRSLSGAASGPIGLGHDVVLAGRGASGNLERRDDDGRARRAPARRRVARRGRRPWRPARSWRTDRSRWTSPRRPGALVLGGVGHADRAAERADARARSSALTTRSAPTLSDELTLVVVRLARFGQRLAAVGLRDQIVRAAGRGGRQRRAPCCPRATRRPRAPARRGCRSARRSRPATSSRTGRSASSWRPRGRRPGSASCPTR